MGSCSLENRGDLALHTGLGGQVQMSLVKYPAVWETLVGTSLARGGLRSWLEKWFGIRLLFIVVVLEAVHLSLISLAVGLISHDEQSRGRLAGDHGVPLTRLFRL
jgi:hypothetical protein